MRVGGGWCCGRVVLVRQVRASHGLLRRGGRVREHDSNREDLMWRHGVVVELGVGWWCDGAVGAAGLVVGREEEEQQHGRRIRRIRPESILPERRIIAQLSSPASIGV